MARFKNEVKVREGDRWWVTSLHEGDVVYNEAEELRKERDRYKNEAARWRGYYYRLWRYYKWQKSAV